MYFLPINVVLDSIIRQTYFGNSYFYIVSYCLNDSLLHWGTFDLLLVSHREHTVDYHFPGNIPWENLLALVQAQAKVRALARVTNLTTRVTTRVTNLNYYLPRCNNRRWVLDIEDPIR